MMTAFLPDQTRISQVHLRTADLAGALAFYMNVIGLRMIHPSDHHAVLSTSQESPSLLHSEADNPVCPSSPSAFPEKRPGLILLSEDVNAQPRPPHSTGLYHLALRYSTRADLARVYRRLVKKGYPIAGASDHGVSEAIYLRDPDDNGLELYADRPRARWPRRNGQIEMATLPLDLDRLLDRAANTCPDVPSRAVLGHIHLQVSELASAERFYSEFLGLAVTQRSYPGVLFFAAGGYHHHLATNIWAGKTPPPENSIGLISYRLEVPETEVLYCLSHRAPLLGYETRIHAEAPPLLQIRDPNGSWLEIQSLSSLIPRSQ